MPLKSINACIAQGARKRASGAAEGPSLAPGGLGLGPPHQLDLPQRSGRAAAPGTAKIGAGSAFGFLAQPPGRRTAMAQLAATQPVTALRPHTPPPIAAPVNIRPGEDARAPRVLERRLVVGTRSSPPINVPRPDDDDDDEAAAVSQQDSLYEYRRYLFWLRLRRGGIAGNDYEAENGDPPRRSRSPPL